MVLTGRLGPTTVVEEYPTRAIRPLQSSRSQIEGRMHKKIAAIGRLNPILWFCLSGTGTELAQLKSF